MQINGVGSSQSGEVRYQNNRSQYQSTSDKAADGEESVILTLSTEAVEKSKESKSVELIHPKAKAEAEAETVDWLQQIIQRVKAFFLKIWNEDSTKVSEAPQEIVIDQEHSAEDNHAQTEQIQPGMQREEVLPQTIGVRGEENIQQTVEIKQEETDPIRENTSQGTFGELLRPLLDVIKRFLADPFSDEPLVTKKQEQPPVQQDSFAEYAARNGWDESQMAHQMQMKSQLGDTYNRKGQPARMTQEVSSNLSFKS